MKIAIAPVLAIVAMAGAAPAVAQDSAVEHVDAAGASFPYVTAGAGEPVLFVHGAFSDHRIWEPMREAVAGDHRFLAYTQRHFGPEDWPETPGSTVTCTQPISPPCSMPGASRCMSSAGPTAGRS